MRVYLPPDANTLLSRRRPLPAQPQLRQRRSSRASSRRSTTCRWTTRSCTARAGSASGSGRRTTATASPTSCSRCAGDIPTLETLAAAALLREHLPELRVRVVNVVDLMRLQPDTEHPHGLVRPRVRRALHHRQAGRLRLPRLSVADPPPHVPAHESREPARARLQGRGDDDDAVRHGDAERPRPLPPRDRRHRPRPGPRHGARAPAAGDGRRAAALRARTRASTARTIRRSRLGLARLTA